MKKKTQRTFVSHYAIFDYWKDKCITEDGDVEIEIGYYGHDDKKANEKNSVPVVNDWGEPECWACGRSMSGQFYAQCEKMDLKQIWNHREVCSRLNKCHIFPKSLGGNENPDNMFLLCESCHFNSPDTRFPKEFFRWFYKRKQRRGTDEALALIDVIDDLNKRNIPPLIAKGDLTFKNMGTHGGLLIESSKFAALRGAAEERWEAIKKLLSSFGCDYAIDTFKKCFTETLSTQETTVLSCMSVDYENEMEDESSDSERVAEHETA